MRKRRPTNISHLQREVPPLGIAVIALRQIQEISPRDIELYAEVVGGERDAAPGREFAGRGRRAARVAEYVPLLEGVCRVEVDGHYGEGASYCSTSSSCDLIGISDGFNQKGIAWLTRELDVVLLWDVQRWFTLIVNNDS